MLAPIGYSECRVAKAILLLLPAEWRMVWLKGSTLFEQNILPFVTALPAPRTCTPTRMCSLESPWILRDSSRKTSLRIISLSLCASMSLLGGGGGERGEPIIERADKIWIADNEFMQSPYSASSEPRYDLVSDTEL